MSLAATAALLISLAALFSYLNHRFIRLPGTIGLMLIALTMSVAILALGKLGVHFDEFAQAVVGSIDFDRTLMGGMLGFLLFAGALHIDIAELAEQKWPVAFLAIASVMISTALVGAGLYYALGVLGQPIPFVWCLVFGALISPTDPIAVLSIIRSVGAPKPLEMKIAGESLFNDGVGVVVFLELVGIATGQTVLDTAEIVSFFAREALGGAAFGFALGYVVFRMLRSVDNYEVEVLLTVALVMGGYTAATAIGVSGPIAIVVAGLLIGNHGRRFAMSEKTREHLDDFWELIDSILNAVLFVLIGLEMLLLHFGRATLAPALLAISVVLLARLLSVALPALLPYLRRWFDRKAVAVLTWGGLRGGISVALALSLPETPYRQTIIRLTYAVVLFSIVVQGLTVSRLIKVFMPIRTE
ncbi:MAG: cation:proton antiporter [Betaproteobacteria bacterium]|jgi:CPA1 family monovalent cation:H+ antiporter